MFRLTLFSVAALTALAVPRVAAAQSPTPPAPSALYRVHGDTLWTTSSVAVTRTVQHGDTLWLLMTGMADHAPIEGRYVLRGDSAYTTIKGVPVVVPAWTLPRMKDYEKWREVDAIARTVEKPPQ
jgi:hypothetical protein